MKKIKKSKESKELSLKQALGAIWRTIKTNIKVGGWRYPARFALYAVEVGGNLLATFIGSRILGEIVTSVAQASATPNLYKLAILEAVILLIINFSTAMSNIVDRIMWIKWDEWFYLTSSECRAGLDTDFFEDRENQKLLNKVSARGSGTMSNLSNQITYTFYNLLKMLLIFGSVIAFNPWLVFLITISTLPRIYTELKRSKLNWSIWGTKGDEYHRHRKTLDLFIDQKDLMEIKLFGLKQRLLGGVAKVNLDKFSSAQIKASKSTMLAENVSHVTYEATFLGINLYLISKTVSRVISIANFTFFIGILNQFSSSVRNLVSIVSRSTEAILYAGDFFQLLDAKPQITSPPDAIKLNKTKIPLIEFKDVSFAYRSNPKEKILHNLNLTINPGEHLALVGENGAGKTTIIKLLLRLYDVTEGQILVNGINIKKLDLNSYWRQIGVLFQDFNRYPFDIQTNIELGRITKKPTKKELDRAVELANLKPILKKLPKGINTILDNSFEEGVEPSGGQWQRVALARAFYRNSNILILDEPTAAVDANAEYEIFNNIFAHYGEKTALIISHRFSTVKRAQRIVVLEQGQIIEQGTHKELIKNSKLYAEMFNKQAEGYQT